MRIIDLLDALRPKTGLSQANQRAREMQKRMKELLKADRKTFEKGLRELGLDDQDEEFKEAVKIYEATF